MVSELIGKYIWLIQTLIAAGERGLSLGQIRDKYERRYNQAYSRRSFNNHRSAAQDVFGIDIECDRSTNRYFIPYGEDALDGDQSIKWMINTFTVSNLLTLGKERLSGRICVEEVPSGQKFLTSIMQAMQEERELEITYRKYKSDSAETIHVQPFAIKEHERRWYLVGFCHERAPFEDSPNSDRSAWRVYGLDRITSLVETGVRFAMPKDFDIDGLFSRSFGIFFPQPGQEAVRVRFKATEHEAKYIRDLPIHHSQKEEGRTEDNGSIFSIRVIPDQNLHMEFCRHAARIEVLEPEEVRAAVAAELRNASKQYEQ